MGSYETKEVTIELTQSTFEKFKEYCRDTSSEKSEIMEDLIRYFLDECNSTLVSMREGYKEMGKINLEICSDFKPCEDEVHSKD